MPPKSGDTIPISWLTKRIFLGSGVCGFDHYIYFNEDISCKLESNIKILFLKGYCQKLIDRLTANAGLTFEETG